MKEYIVTEHYDFPYEEPKPHELIRCKDCKHQKTAKYHQGETVYAVSYCGLMNYYYPIGEDDDFCSKAERKEE